MITYLLSKYRIRDLHPDNVEEETESEPPQKPPPVDKRFFIPDCDHMVMWKEVHDVEYARAKEAHMDKSEGEDLVEEDLSGTTLDKSNDAEGDVNVHPPTTDTS